MSADRATHSTRGRSDPGSGTREFPRRTPGRWAWPAVAAAGLSLILIPFAEPLHRAVYGFLSWLPLEEFFSTSKQLAGATCVISMLAIIWMFDSPRRRALVVLLIALGVSALINETIKQVTGRFRPGDSVLLDEEDMADRLEYIAAHPGTPVTAERKDQWLLFKKNRPWFDSDFASFPSGHANTAFVLAAFLLVLYPRGRWIWFVLAVGCALARVRFRRHFPEDILMGGALGWLIAHWVFSWGWPMRLTDRLFERNRIIRALDSL